MKILLFSSLLLLVSPPLGFAEEAEVAVVTSLDAIEALVYREQFGEALLPLSTVTGDQKNDRWRKLVERAAVGHLSTLTREAPAGADGVANQLAKEYPFLRRVTDFNAATAHLVRVNLQSCLENGPDNFACGERAFGFIADSAEPPWYYLELAELLAKKASVAAAVPFIKLSEEKNRYPPPSPHRARGYQGCQSAEAQRLLSKAVALPSGEPKAMAMALLEGPCREVGKKLRLKAGAKGRPNDAPKKVSRPPNPN